MNEIRFEFKRLWRTKLTWGVFVTLIILVSVPYFQMSTTTVGQQIMRYKTEKMTADQNYEQLAKIKLAKKTAVLEKQRSQLAQKVVDRLQTHENSVPAELKYWRAVRSETQSGRLQGDSMLTINMELAQLEWAQKNQARLFGNSREMPAANYVGYVLWRNLSPMLLIALLVILMTYTLIPENGLAGRRFLATISVAKWQKISAKFLSIYVTYFGMLLVSFVPISLFLLLKNGAGSLQYLLVSTVDGEKILQQTLGHYVATYLVMFGLLSLSIGGLALIIAHFVKTALVQSGLLFGLLILAGTTPLLKQGLASKFLPTSYLNLNAVIIGQKSVVGLVPNLVSVQLVMMVLLSWFIAMLSVGIILAYRRRYL